MMAAIFNHLWQSTVFVVAVALLAFAFRRNRARLRYGLWFVASVKFLVPFVVLAAAGSFLEWRQPPAPIASVMTAPGDPRIQCAVRADITGSSHCGGDFAGA